MLDFLKKYLTNVTGLQVFQLLRFCIVFLIGILLLKGGLSTEELGGIYEPLLFLGGLLSYFWVSGLIQGFLSAYADYKDKEGRLFFNTAISLFVCSAVAAGAFYLLVNAYPRYAQLEGYSAPFAFYMLLLGPSFLVEYIYLLKGKPYTIILYGLVIFIGQLLAVTLPIFLDYGLIWSIWGLLGIAIIRFLWLVKLLMPLSNWELDKGIVKLLLKLAWPLILSSLLSGSAEYIDGILVTYYFDDATFAIFRYGAREMPFFLLIATAFSNSMVPEISQAKPYLGDVLKRIRRNSLGMMHVFFPMTAVLMLLSPILYPLLFKPEFIESAVIFNVYLLLLISRLLFPQTILIGMQKTQLIFGSAFLELLINVSLSIILIQWFGLIGVAFATVIASISEKFILAYFVRKSLGIKVASYVEMRWYLGYVIALLVIFVTLAALN